MAAEESCMGSYSDGEACDLISEVVGRMKKTQQYFPDVHRHVQQCVKETAKQGKMTSLFKPDKKKESVDSF